MIKRHMAPFLRHTISSKKKKNMWGIGQVKNYDNMLIQLHRYGERINLFASYNLMFSSRHPIWVLICLVGGAERSFLLELEGTHWYAFGIFWNLMDVCLKFGVILQRIIQIITVMAIYHL